MCLCHLGTFTGDKRQVLHTEIVNIFHMPSVIKQRRMEWVVHVTRICEMINAQKNFSRKT